MNETDAAIVAAAEERDKALHYCATCHSKVYGLTDDDEPHNYTVEECDRRAALAVAASQSKPRLPDPVTGHLCWAPEQHHPFIEGPVPEYAYEEWATLDRRELLRIVREQDAARRCNCECGCGNWPNRCANCQAGDHQLTFGFSGAAGSVALEALTAAALWLEGVGWHSVSCPGASSEGAAPCNCGYSRTRDHLALALRALAADSQPERVARSCGARAIGGPCIGPAGHNMGHVDIPANHWADPVRPLGFTAEGTLRGEEPRPEVVVLCGSTRFYDAFQQANYDLTMQGKIVLSVGFYPHAKAVHGHGEGVGHDSVEKVALDELHLRKIDLADRVLVLNVGGYIGSSTRREIDYAVSVGRPIDYLEPGAVRPEEPPS